MNPWIAKQNQKGPFPLKRKDSSFALLAITFYSVGAAVCCFLSLSLYEKKAKRERKKKQKHPFPNQTKRTLAIADWWCNIVWICLLLLSLNLQKLFFAALGVKTCIKKRRKIARLILFQSCDLSLSFLSAILPIPNKSKSKKKR